MNNIVLDKILNRFFEFEQVKSVAIGGSGVNYTSDNMSDIDVYVFVESDIPVKERESFIKEISSKYEVGGEYFGSGDEFFANELGLQLDIMYWNIHWFEDSVNNVWLKHYPSNGYTTAFLFTLKNFEIKYDKDNWLHDLQNLINTPYPQELKQNIIKRNIMLMKDKPFASYYEQIKKAVKRKDYVSVNHRVSVFLASYFDIIFAINELLHPGEKRLVKYAIKNCKYLPENFEQNINKLLTISEIDILETLDIIVKNLKTLIIYNLSNI